MKLTNSLGFLSIGSVMFLLPQLAPNLCPPDMFGYSIRETWLHVMGLTQMVIGGSFLMRKAGAEFAGWLERWPELLEVQPSAPEFDPVPQAGTPVYSFQGIGQPVGELIPVEFKSAWTEQRVA